jgi:hypothetical protein
VDGRDWAVKQTYFRLPPGLRLLCRCYQNDRKITTLNAAVIELLETHPEIQRIYRETLDKAVTTR